MKIRQEVTKLWKYMYTVSCQKELGGTVVTRLDFCAGDPGSIPAGAEFQTGI